MRIRWQASRLNLKRRLNPKRNRFKKMKNLLSSSTRIQIITEKGFHLDSRKRIINQQLQDVQFKKDKQTQSLILSQPLSIKESKMNLEVHSFLEAQVQVDSKLQNKEMIMMEITSRCRWEEIFCQRKSLNQRNLHLLRGSLFSNGLRALVENHNNLKRI